MFSQGAVLRGTPVVARAPIVARASRVSVTVSAETASPRFRLDNIGPAKGSRRPEKRKGRGYGAGQGGPCGFGMRGQNSRSGPSTRPGFEGGQTSLYRRLPKLKGIAGGMGAGLSKTVVINVADLASKFSEGEEVSLEALKAKNLVSTTGRQRNFGIKVLGTGELAFPLTVTAELFSKSALAKIEAAGGTAVTKPVKAKWTRKAHEDRVRRAAFAASKAPQKPAAKKGDKPKNKKK